MGLLEGGQQMQKATADQSGVQPTVAEAGTELATACHQILDAISTFLASVEFLALDATSLEERAQAASRRERR